MAPKASKGPKAQPKPTETRKDYPTISAQLEAEYLASRPYQALKDSKGINGLSTKERSAYALYKFLDTGAWRSWDEIQQKEFWKEVQTLGVGVPLERKGGEELGKDWNGRALGTLSPREFAEWEKRDREVRGLRRESEQFIERREALSRQGKGQSISEGEVEDERNRRKLIGGLTGKKMGRYEGNPEWDDVAPIPQDDGEGALAAIAYTDEYAEAMGYLRAVMAAKEHSPRILKLTEHIISLNAAHYTVWLYRASTISALSYPIPDELTWVNDIALDNQKNYQIWHHRQILIDDLYSQISSDPASIQALAKSEIDFMNQMFDEDSKNYHVWSYRQYLVRKLDLFNKEELVSIEELLRKDIRNNSAWSHRFFVVFSDPRHSTPGSRATEYDPLIPDSILDREIEFAKAATFEAPQNQSPWNYLRGVLKKGDRRLASLEWFALEFVKLGQEEGEGEDVRSSHALDFLADIYVEQGRTEDADKMLKLLGDKYDRIRKNYWDWRRVGLKEGKVHAA